MSKISLAPDASGTGIFTIASPNSNTNRTLTLPDADGTVSLTNSDGTTVISVDSTDPALRITQVGTGNALLVEDAANPDSTPVVIDASGRAVIGYTSALSVEDYAGLSRTPNLQAHGLGGSPSAAYLSSWSNSDTQPSQVIFGKSKSGTVGTNGVVASGTDIGAVVFSADDGTALIPAASILGEVDGTPGTNDMPGRLVFSTTADGASSATERARITSGGYFKASNNGVYVNSTGSYHELRTTANDSILVNKQTNASNSANLIFIDSVRSASSAYNFLLCRSNADGTPDAEFNLLGNGNAYADGTWNNNGADYAEFFESANGEALTLGATVVLDGNKVREATDQDPATSIIGVVRPKEPSKASMVVGNTAWNKWANKYLTDDFDRYIMEDHDVVEWEETITDEEGNTSTKQHSYESHNIPEGITVPEDATRKTHDDKGNKFQHYQLNPAWNPDSEYVNRENRPEWNIIGLLGQVKILKGQPVGDRWIKMRDVSETVEEWMIR